MNLSDSNGKLQLVFLMMIIGSAHFLVDTMLGIWPIYKSLANIDIAKAGLTVAFGALIGEGSQLFFGSFSDKGYRKILIILGLLLSIGTSFLAYSTNYTMLSLLFLITCIGSGCFHPCAASLVNQLVPSRRGLIMTIFAACGSLGLATSQLTYSFVNEFYFGHTYLLAIPSLILAIILFLYSLPEVKKQDTPSQDASIRDFIEFFKNPALRSLYFSQVANQSILWGTIFILPDVLKVLGHSDWVCYGGGHLCFVLGAACMVIPGGYLADLFSARQVMLYGSLISCVSFYFILFTGGISMTVILISLFVLGSTLALMNPLSVAMGNRLEPNRSGAVSAFLMGLVWCISEALGPGGVGLMSRFFDDYAPVKALVVLGTLFLIQIYAIIALPKDVPILVPAERAN